MLSPAHLGPPFALDCLSVPTSLISRFDVVEVFDGPTFTSPQLTPISNQTGRGGFSGLYFRLPQKGPGDIRLLGVNTSGASLGGMLIQFHSDLSQQESGFLFGWTVLPLPVDGKHCALDCKICTVGESCENDMRGNGHCDAACMNEFCEWDRGDCMNGGPLQCAPGCSTVEIGDGTCHPNCMVPACNFDARDCECLNVIETVSGYRTEGTTVGSDYDNEAHTCWLLRPKLQGVTNITISFARFDTERFYDALEIFDGAHVGFKRLYSLSGTRMYIPPVTSSGPEVLLKFRADGSGTFNGFLFGWTSIIAGEGLPAGQCAHRCLPNMHGNGFCDTGCMNEACDWDGGDCWGTCTSRTSGGSQATCFAMQLGNGECDAECMSVECGYDHGDCSCSNVLSGRYGFRSVGSEASGYGDQSRQCWLIQPVSDPPDAAASVSTISLTFHHFETEAHFDAVLVFDGPYPLHSAYIAPGIGHEGDPHHGLSGLVDVKTLPPLVARSPSMLVTFLADESVSGFSGFLFGWTSTFANDPELRHDHCAVDCTSAMRGDGRCDAACMNQACGWDSKGSAVEGQVGDCELECYAPTGCRMDQLGNGICEPACSVAECGYDAADCTCTNVRTECDGSATDGSELTAHYNNGQHSCWLIQPAHVNTRIQLHWNRFDTEASNDFVRVCAPTMPRTPCAAEPRDHSCHPELGVDALTL